jgi:hypothetical protein
MSKRNAQTTLVLRTAIPLRSATHGIRVAQAIQRMYAGVSDIVSISDRRTVMGYREIRHIELTGAQD